MTNTRELRDRAIIRPIKRAVEDQLLDLPGVVAVDIGEKRVGSRPEGEQVIVVSVSRKEPDERLVAGTRVPSSVLGVPTDVIEERAELHHDHRRVPFPAGGVHRQPGTRSVLGGAGVAVERTVEWGLPGQSGAGGHHRVGTIGALVLDRAATAGTMGLTTFDVACMDDAWSVGDRMIDPCTGHVCGELARAALSGRVDAAAIEFDNGTRHGFPVSGRGPVTGQSAARTGEAVRKSGYGTSLTNGVVTSTDLTLRVDHGDALGVRILREQVRVRSAAQYERFAAPGDAGAVLVNMHGRVVGLHIAGSADGRTGFACPIADVLTELDTELCLTSQRLNA